MGYHMPFKHQASNYAKQAYTLQDASIEHERNVDVDVDRQWLKALSGVSGVCTSADTLEDARGS